MDKEPGMVTLHPVLGIMAGFQFAVLPKEVLVPPVHWTLLDTVTVTTPVADWMSPLTAMRWK